MKVRAAHDPVRRALADLGATDRGRVRQVDTYYDAPGRDFGETDEALRVRRESEEREAPTGEADPRGTSAADDAEIRLTYKGPLVEEGSKTRVEHETAIADGDALDAILDSLGYEPAATVEKERHRFEHAGYVVTLDRVADLGEFVEVETHAATVDPAREGARDLLERLGLDPDEQIRTSYLAMLLDNQGA